MGKLQIRAKLQKSFLFEGTKNLLKVYCHFTRNQNQERMGTQNRDVEAFRFCLLAVMNKNSNNDISYNFNSGQIFHTFKLCVKSIFLGWHLLTDNSLYMIYMRQHIIRPTFFPSYRAKYKRAIRCPTKRPDFLQSELSSVSV